MACPGRNTTRFSSVQVLREQFLVILRHGLRRNPRHGGDGVLDLDVDGLLALLLRQQHLRGTGLIDHVDGLVRQLAVIDVARRQFHRRLIASSVYFDLVEVLEIGLQALQDLDRIRHRRLVHIDLLEPAHQARSFSKNWRYSL
jgi:hypothetical protein